MELDSHIPFKDKAASYLKAAFGTWTLLFTIIAVIIFWLMEVNDPGELRLNLGLSFLASVQGVILQIAANRGDKKMEQIIRHILTQTDEIDRLIKENTELTKAIHYYMTTHTLEREK